jgi:hypothetical protein
MSCKMMGGFFGLLPNWFWYVIGGILFTIYNLGINTIVGIGFGTYGLIQSKRTRKPEEKRNYQEGSKLWFLSAIPLVGPFFAIKKIFFSV